MTFDVGIKISAQGGEQARRELSGVEQKLDSMSGALQRVGTYGAALLVVLPMLKQLASQFIQTADSVTMLRNQLNLASGSSQAASKAYNELFQIAQRSRVGFTELGSTYATVARAGADLGISQRRLLGVTQAIGNAMTISGGSASSMQAALVQLSQGLGSGTLRGEELNSVMEQTPRLAKAMADGLGIPLGQLRKLGEQGELTAEQVIAALESQSTKLAAEVGSSIMTVSQGMTVLSNSMTDFIGQADAAAGATSALASILVDVGRAIEWIVKETPTLEALRIVGEAVRLVWSDIVFVFAGVGREIGGIAAQTAAVLKGDFSGSAAIREAMIEDAKAARKALDEYQKNVVTRPQAQGDSDSEAENARLQRGTTEYRARQKAVSDLARIKQELAGVDKDYIKTVQRLAELRNADVISTTEYVSLLKQAAAATKDGRAAAQQTLKDQRDLAEAAKKNAEWRDQQYAEQAKLRLEAIEDAEKYAQAQMDTYNQDALTAEKQAQTLEEELALYGKLQSEIAAVTLEKLKARQAGLDPEDNNRKTLERQIEAQRRVVSALQQREGREASEAAAKAAMEDWKRASQDMERSITDALMRAFEAGKGFAESLKDTVVNMFKTLVLRPIVQAIVQPISGAALSFLGMPGAARASSGASGLSSLSGAGSMLGGLSGFFSAGSTAGMASFGNAAAALQGSGQLLAGGQIGSGLSLGAGSIAGALGPAMLGIGVGKTISGQYSAIGGSGNTAIGAGTAIGAIFGGPIGAGIGAAIGGVVNRAFGRGPKKVTERGITGSFEGGDFTGQAYENWKRKGGWLRSTKRGTDYDPISEAQQDALNSGGQAMLATVQEYAKALNLPAEYMSKVTAKFKVKLTGDAAKDQVAISEALDGYGNALSDFLKLRLQPLAKAGEKTLDTLQRLAGLQNFSKSMNELGGVFAKVARLSFSAREELIGLAGGLDQLVSKSLQFVQDYYSRDEIAGMKAGEIQGALRGLGITQDVNSRADFRSLVDSTDVSTPGGRQQLNALLDLSQSFTAVADYLQETGLSLSQASANAPRGGVLAPAFSAQDSTTQQVTAVNGVRAAVEAVRAAILDQTRALASGARVTVAPAQETRLVTSPYSGNRMTVRG